MIRTGSSGIRHDRRGTALITAMLVIVMMTVALAGGFALVSAEQRTIGDQQSQVAALGVAQQGLDAYLRHPENAAFRPGRTVNLPPRDNDTMWVPVNAATGDTAIVIARLFRKSTLTTVDTVYALRSIGRRGIVGLKGTPPAQRTIAELVSWSTSAKAPVKAAWLSLSGMSKNGVSGTISGTDATPSCGSGNLAGVSVPRVPGYDGPNNPVSGSPAVDTNSLGFTSQSGADSLTAAGLDWANWSQGSNLPNVWRTSDHGGAFPSFTDTTYYPVIYVNGDVTLPDGRGMLIVSGSLTINGSTNWNGMLLVGGTVTSNGNNDIEGAVMSGLNIMLGQTVAATSLGNGNKTFQYSSCEVKKAMGGAKAFVVRQRTWTDNWKMY